MVWRDLDNEMSPCSVLLSFLSVVSGQQSTVFPAAPSVMSPPLFFRPCTPAPLARPVPIRLGTLMLGDNDTQMKGQQGQGPAAKCIGGRVYVTIGLRGVLQATVQ